MVPSPEGAEQSGLVKPEQIIPACLGELYRYRLAVQDQLPRIETATQALRAQREQIEKDEREHLFAPTMDREGWKAQLDEIHHGDVPEMWRVKTEAQFLLDAV